MFRESVGTPTLGTRVDSHYIYATLFVISGRYIDATMKRAAIILLIGGTVPWNRGVPRHRDRPYCLCASLATMDYHY